MTLVVASILKRSTRRRWRTIIGCFSARLGITFYVIKHFFCRLRFAHAHHLATTMHHPKTRQRTTSLQIDIHRRRSTLFRWRLAHLRLPRSVIHLGFTRCRRHFRPVTGWRGRYRCTTTHQRDHQEQPSFSHTTRKARLNLSVKGRSSTRRCVRSDSVLLWTFFGQLHCFHMKQSLPSMVVHGESITLKRQPYYCEENAWHLCQEPFIGDEKRHVVFISNLECAVPMWNQSAGRGKPVEWDYHVVVLTENPAQIWDVDSLLGIPIQLFDYLAGSFHPEMPECYQPCFRVVPSDVFIDVFASDRSHMKRTNGSYRKPPPSWPIIGKPGTASNLMQFTDMRETFVGDVLSLDELRRRFGSQDEAS